MLMDIFWLSGSTYVAASSAVLSEPISVPSIAAAPIVSVYAVVKHSLVIFAVRSGCVTFGIASLSPKIESVHCFLTACWPFVDTSLYYYVKYHLISICFEKLYAFILMSINLTYLKIIHNGILIPTRLIITVSSRVNFRGASTTLWIIAKIVRHIQRMTKFMSKCLWKQKHFRSCSHHGVVRLLRIYFPKKYYVKVTYQHALKFRASAISTSNPLRDAGS